MFRNTWVWCCIPIPIKVLKQSFLCEGSFKGKTSLGQCVHNLYPAKEKEKYFREASLSIKRQGEELVSVTDLAWKTQLQTLRNMTKASLPQSIKRLEKLIAKLKIPFTYAFCMLLITPPALFLWIQGIWGKLLLEHFACAGMPNMEALKYMHLCQSLISSSDSCSGVTVLLHGTSCSYQAELY